MHYEGIGKIYIIEENGKAHELDGIIELETEECSNTARKFIANERFEITLGDFYLPTRSWLSLMGLPISNNWRKMHGGIMDRKCRRKKVQGKRGVKI